MSVSRDSAAIRSARSGRSAEVVADAALAPHDQVDVLPREPSGQRFLAGEPVVGAVGRHRAARRRSARRRRIVGPRRPQPRRRGRGGRRDETRPRAGTRDRRTETSTVTATLTATTRKLSSHTPPTEASRSAGSTCHWLDPSRPHGPPSPCQERTSSITSQPDGRPAARRRPAPARAYRPGTGAPASAQGAHSAPSRPAMRKVNTCRLGSSQWCMASMNAEPAEPAVVRRPAAGRGRADQQHPRHQRRRTPNHHRPGAGNASTGRAPATTTATDRRHGEAIRSGVLIQRLLPSGTSLQCARRGRSTTGGVGGVGVVGGLGPVPAGRMGGRGGRAGAGR